MLTLEEKFEAIDDRFKNPSKARDAARYIVKKNHKITSEERKAIIETIPIKRKTLEGVFTELRKLNLYPPQKTVEKPKRTPALEKPEEPARHIQENPPPPLQEYATREDLNTLRTDISNDIRYLAAVIGGDEPSNPGESEEKVEVEGIQSGAMYIPDASLTRASVFLTPLTQIYHDMAKEGEFSYYPGTQKESPFAVFMEGHKNFKGLLTLSDFVNNAVIDYFIRTHNAVIGVKGWRDLR